MTNNTVLSSGDFFKFVTRNITFEITGWGGMGVSDQLKHTAVMCLIVLVP